MPFLVYAVQCCRKSNEWWDDDADNAQCRAQTSQAVYMRLCGLPRYWDEISFVGGFSAFQNRQSKASRGKRRRAISLEGEIPFSLSLNRGGNASSANTGSNQYNTTADSIGYCSLLITEVKSCMQRVSLPAQPVRCSAEAPGRQAHGGQRWLAGS